MSRIQTTTLAPQETVNSSSGDLRNVDLNEFLTLLITEMQNQDPLDPMKNSEILEQIGQIREISATDKLSDTLQAVLTSQNLAAAGNLIGKQVTALSEDAQDVAGIVDRVSIERRNGPDSVPLLRVHIGEHSVEMKNIRDIRQ